MTVTIYHNPDCGTSRNTLAMIRQSGEEPVVIEYLKHPPGRAMLAELVQAMGISARELLREKGTPYAELGLGDPKWSDGELLDFMVAHPILMNRPIVVTPKGARLCRPSELVLDLLDSPAETFTKEDGKWCCPVADLADLPNVIPAAFEMPKMTALKDGPLAHRPRILLLYGSLRERSFSRFLTMEAARLLEVFFQPAESLTLGIPKVLVF